MKKYKNIFITQHYKAPLSTTIAKEYNALVTAISQVPESLQTSKLIEGTGGKVSVRDILAYQIGWGLLLIGWYKSGLKNQVPQMPGDGFTTWDYTELAQHFYIKYEQDTISKQLAMFHDIVEQILDIVEKEYKTNTLDSTGVWAWCTLPSGKQWPLSKWIAVNTSSPYKRAKSLIKKILKTLDQKI